MKKQIKILLAYMQSRERFANRDFSGIKRGNVYFYSCPNKSLSFGMD